jgi:hypothetical protein
MIRREKSRVGGGGGWRKVGSQVKKERGREESLTLVGSVLLQKVGCHQPPSLLLLFRYHLQLILRVQPERAGKSEIIDIDISSRMFSGLVDVDDVWT